jgi:hypothetical protein
MKFGDIDSTRFGFGQSQDPQKDCWMYITITGSIKFSKGGGFGRWDPKNPSSGKVTIDYKVTTECRCLEPFTADQGPGFGTDPGVEWDEGGTASVGECQPDGSRNFEYHRQKLIMKDCKNEHSDRPFLIVQCKEGKSFKSDTKEMTFDEFLNHTTAAGSVDIPQVGVEPEDEDSGGFLMWSGHQNAGQQMCGKEFGEDSGCIGCDPNACKAWYKTLQDTTVECGAAEDADDKVPPDAPKGSYSGWPMRLTYAPASEGTAGEMEMINFQKCLLEKMLCPDGGKNTEVVEAFLNAFLSGNMEGGGLGGGSGQPLDDGPLDDAEAKCLEMRPD